jgi:starch synthase (maltosyl-transferring)
MDPSKEFRAHDLLNGDIWYWRGEYQFVELNPYLMPAHIFRLDQ